MQPGEVNWLAPLEWSKTKFLCRQLRFQCRLFLLLRFLHRPHGVSPKPARPLVAPSKDYFHGGGLGLPLFREGRRTKDAQQSRKKKTMKTNTKNQIGLKSKSAQLSSTDTTHRQQRAQLRQWQKPDNRLPIDAEARKKNRTLPITKVLELLKTSNPGLFNLAEVVGRWVWVAFRETPAPEIAADVGAAWFPLEPRASGMAAPLRRVPFGQRSTTRTRSIPAISPPTSGQLD